MTTEAEAEGHRINGGKFSPNFQQIAAATTRVPFVRSHQSVMPHRAEAS